MTKLTQEQGEKAIAIVLRYGALLATVVMAVGITLTLVHGIPATIGESRPVHLELLVEQVLRLEPVAIIELGILLLLFTPIARIVIAVIGFALERQWKYVAISLGVLAVVLLSISFAIET